MQQTQLQTLSMLEDALATATHNPPPSPPPDFPALLGDLTTAITQAKAAAVTQAADRGSRSTALRAARTTLLDDYLIPIRDIAIGRLTAVTNVRQLFRVPARTVHRATLLKEATILVDNATRYKDTFIASGMPADFLDQLNTAIANVVQASTSYVTTWGDQQRATQQIQVALKQGKQCVLGLNGIMQVVFAKNPDVLVVWNSARHIRRAAAVAGPVASSGTTSPTIPATAPSMSSITPSVSAPPVVASPVLHAA